MNFGRVYIIDLYPQLGHRLFNLVLFRQCLRSGFRAKGFFESNRVIVCTYNVRRHYLLILILTILKRGKLILINHNNVELALKRPFDRSLMFSLDWLGIRSWNFSPIMTDTLKSWGFKRSFTKSLELRINQSGSLKNVKCFFYKSNKEMETFFTSNGFEIFIRHSYITDSALYKVLCDSEFVYLSYSNDYTRFSGMAMYAIVCGCNLIVDNERDYHSLNLLYQEKVFLFNADIIGQKG